LSLFVFLASLLFLSLGVFFLPMFLDFLLDGVLMSRVDDVFKRIGVGALLPSEFGGLHVKRVCLLGAGSFC
jgi:hypothetical protein